MIKIKLTIKGNPITPGDIVFEGTSELPSKELASRLFHLEWTINQDMKLRAHTEMIEESEPNKP